MPDLLGKKSMSMVKLRLNHIDFLIKEISLESRSESFVGAFWELMSNVIQTRCNRKYSQIILNI